MRDIGLTHIALPVKSLEKSIAFYSAYAGLKVIHRRDNVAWISDQLRPFAIVLIESDAEICASTLQENPHDSKVLIQKFCR